MKGRKMISAVNSCNSVIQTKPIQFKGEQNLAEPVTDKEKSNATKLMIGATALAGIVALGIAGYKGKLGKAVQEFLGGVEKSEKTIKSNCITPESPTKSSKITDIIVGDGTKVGIRTEAYDSEKGILSVIETYFDADGSVRKIYEKSDDKFSTLLKLKNGNWSYKESYSDGTIKKMRVEFTKDGRYSTSSMNMSPAEKDAVREKLREIGVELKKLDG